MNPAGSRAPRFWLLAVFGFVVSTFGCERYDRPHKPLPADFEVKTLDGKTLRRDDFLGKPWVINLWVPG